MRVFSMKINDVWVPILLLVAALMLFFAVSVESQEVWAPGPGVGTGSLQEWTEINTGRTKTFVVPPRLRYRNYGYGSDCLYCNPVDGFLQNYIRGMEAAATIRQLRAERPARPVPHPRKPWSPESARAEWGMDR